MGIYQSDMSKILVIVESPAKIKKISSILGKDYILRASYGHIIDLSKSDKKNNLGVELNNKYKPIYETIPDKKDKIKAIVDAAKQVDKIYIASDPDREGEAIAWHLRSCLESLGKPIFRVTFNPITEKAVKEAVKNPGQINEALFEAQQSRRVLDRIVGFRASDSLRSSLGRNLSAGRCQSVAIRLIVDREREIESFKPEEYWTINVGLAKDDKGFIAKYTGKVKNKQQADIIKKDLDSDSYVVEKVEAKEKKRNPYPPLITSTLQQVASGRFGFPVKRTMAAAQSLYEAGLITYMRTDAVTLSPEATEAIRSYLKNNNFDIPKTPNIYVVKAEAQAAHEAIRVSDVNKHPDNLFLQDDLIKIYRLIWERTVASQMLPAIYDTVSVTVKSSSKHELKANGRTLKYEGWLAILKDNIKEKDGEDDVMLPILKIKDKLVLFPPKVVCEQKFTQPPPRFTEASLVKILEQKEIGRPSTYGAIIEAIKFRNYVETKGKAFIATEVGKQVTDNLIKFYKFMDYDYTAQMEKKLDQVGEGKISYFDMIDEFYKVFVLEYKKSKAEGESTCGIMCDCGQLMILKLSKFGQYVKCSDSNCKQTKSVEVNGSDIKVVPKKWGEKRELSEGKVCPNCGSGMIKRSSKFGDFFGCSKYPKCKGVLK